MMDKYNEYVVRDILAGNKFFIQEVKELESLNTRMLDRNEYAEIETLINEGNIEAIKTLPENNVVDEFREYLDIMMFKDQNRNSYFVTVYDSDELWQNPSVIKIYRM